MATSLIFKPAGIPKALSVANSAHGAVSVSQNQNDNVNAVGLLNTGTTVVAVWIAPQGKGVTPTFPTDATPITASSNAIQVVMLPASMTYPMIVPCPSLSDVDAIGSAAGPSIVYVTPIIIQS
jgi:hypothetical protein